MPEVIQQINDSTFKLTVNNDPKDFLEVEIGDAKQEEFYPQIKIKRWDNECNFSVRLKDNETGIESFRKEGEKIIYSKGNINVEYYDHEDGFKMVWFLKEKPTTNKVEFTLQSKDVVFYYQPELTQKEKDEGAERPENVVGSYAVYHSTKGGMNDINGMDYKVGKFGHIFRPRLKDSNGWEVWGDLKIENGTYEVTIPQDFYDNAVYPIKSNDTFGNTTVGGSASDWTANFIILSMATLSEAGTGNSMTIYTYDSGQVYKAAIYQKSDDTFVKGTVEGTNTASVNWKTQNFTGGDPSLTAQDYLLAFWSDTTTHHFYDSWANDSYYDNETYGIWPDPLAKTTYQTRRVSIYVTYTPSVGGEEYIMSVTVGAFTLTGIVALLIRGYTIACVVGSFTLTGISTIFTKALNMAVTVGVFTLTGIATILTKALKMVVTVGTFTLTGISSGLKRGYTIAVSVGAFTLTGVSAGLSKGYTIVASVGSFTLTGITTTFTKAISMAVSVGTFILTGIAAALRKSGWINLAKSTSISPTNVVKNDISPTNLTKNDISPINLTKNDISPTNATKTNSTFINQAKS